MRWRSWPRSRTCACSSTSGSPSDEPVPPTRADPIGSIRTAGGAVLVTAPDIEADDPDAWTCATRRAPTDEEQLDLDLAWRLVRGVTSNAIVLVRDAPPRRDGQRPDVAGGRRAPGRREGAGDARARRDRRARPAPRTRSSRSPTRSRSASRPASGAFAQPGGSMRDARRSPRSMPRTARCSSPGRATSATDRDSRIAP